MKSRLLIFISLFATNLIKNANSVGERGQESKLYKSFDEIFGKGWDDESNDTKDLNCRHVKEEVQDGQAPNTSDQKNIDDILKQKFDEIYDENWSEDENNSAPDQDENVDEQQNESNECEKIKSDQQKREIIQKFREMKDNYQKKNKRGHSNKEWVQIESKISNGLGVGRTKLYKWIKKLGLRKEKNSKVSEFERREIVEEFIKKKNEYKQKRKYSKKEWDQNNSQIAKSIGVNQCTIKKWKKEFGLNEITQQNDYSDQQKREILDNYFLLVEKYKQKGKHSTKEWNKIYEKISKSVGVGLKTIRKWKKEFGLIGRKLHSIQEKREKLKQYCEIKKSNPNIKDFEIAKILNIGRNTLKQWKRELKNAVKDENNCSLQKELDHITQLKIYSDQQKRGILKQFDEIKSKCMKAKLKNISLLELNDKIAKKLGVCRRTIYEWKRKFGLSVSNKSDATKIEILKEYAKIKGKNPKMSDCDIVDLLKISRCTLNRWKAQFSDENKHL